MRNHDPSSTVAGTPPVARDCSEPRFIEAQGSLSQLIELQSKQQDVLWRLIEFQENLLLEDIVGRRPRRRTQRRRLRRP